jgi:hypothetical protein
MTFPDYHMFDSENKHRINNMQNDVRNASLVKQANSANSEYRPQPIRRRFGMMIAKVGLRIAGYSG